MAWESNLQLILIGEHCKLRMGELKIEKVLRFMKGDGLDFKLLRNNNVLEICKPAT